MPNGITFLGKHSYKDFGITMAPSREIGIPNKKKAKVSLPFSNVVYDYSSIFGSQTYEERTVKYTFNIAGREIKTKDEMNWAKTVLINWLMNSNGKQPLWDDNYRNYYFLAEVEGGANFTENWTYGFLEVTFTAYPFMIASYKEGDDVWDTFNFLFDMNQSTKFDMVASAWEHKPLMHGAQATIAAWASTTASGTPGNLYNQVGATGKVLYSEPYVKSYSNVAYKVEGFSDLILEQDIIQACTKYVDITLTNNGTPSVYPELTMVSKAGVTPKVSIQDLKTGLVYNFVDKNPTNNIFQLKSGVNNLRLYGLLDQTIEFTFYKELI
jgi:hypothetical protein